MEQTDKVIDFIRKHFPNADSSDANWLKGNCYYFALILHDRFLSSEIYYDVIHGHFVTLINNCLYDASGVYYKLSEEEKVRLNNTPLSHSIRLDYDVVIVNWQYFYHYDSLQKQRIVEDCID